MKVFKAVLLYIWQLPQNLLGLLLLLIFKCVRINDDFRNLLQFRFYKTNWNFGVSLGMYVIVCKSICNHKSKINHEHGHQRQSMYLGPLYLLLIGIPSFLFNRIDVVFHKKWNTEKREKWYYSKPWEAWADKLGGVKRNFA